MDVQRPANTRPPSTLGEAVPMRVQLELPRRSSAVADGTSWVIRQGGCDAHITSDHEALAPTGHLVVV